MPDQSSTPQTQPQTTPAAPAPDPNAPAQQPANPGGTPQQAVSPALPISPYTGETFEPEWGVSLQKGASSEQGIQQIMRGDIERKVGQSGKEAKK